VLAQCGAHLVDNVEIPGHAEMRAKVDKQDVTFEGLILAYEFKAGIERYLATRANATVRTLADLIRFNDERAAEEMSYFLQETFLEAQSRGSLTDEVYLNALEQTRAFARGFGAIFETQNLDALVAPTNAPPCAIDLFDGDRRLGGSAKAAAVAGFPLVTVPAGLVADLLPLGLTFMGPGMSEPTLIKLAFAFEQAHPVRRSPRFVSSTLDLP
jgi:amidase